MNRNTSGVVAAALVVAFVVCIVAANWAMLNLGQHNGPGHPRTIPVGFGLNAPSGVIFAGAMLTLRDAIHERLGAGRTLGVIVLTAPLTAIVASPGLAVASTLAFLAAEATDLGVYSAIRRYGRLLAVLCSNTVSAVVDSIVFLALAFGAAAVSAQSVAMVVGKFEASVLALGALALVAKTQLGWRANPRASKYHNEASAFRAPGA